MLYVLLILDIQGIPGGSEVKASAWNEGDPGSIPGLGPGHTGKEGPHLTMTGGLGGFTELQHLENVAGLGGGDL